MTTEEINCNFRKRSVKDHEGITGHGFQGPSAVQGSEIPTSARGPIGEQGPIVTPEQRDEIMQVVEQYRPPQTEPGRGFGFFRWVSKRLGL